jgi:hypothetical protein
MAALMKTKGREDLSCMAFSCSQNTCSFHIRLLGILIFEVFYAEFDMMNRRGTGEGSGDGDGEVRVTKKVIDTFI